MKKLLNTLYVTSPDAYLSLDGENIVVYSGEELKGRIPLHTVDSILTFGYTGASPALMGKCAEANKQLIFLKESGKFLARCIGKTYGNVLLRTAQFSLVKQPECSLQLAKNIISAKLSNSSAVLRRAVSDYPERVPAETLRTVADRLKKSAVNIYHADSFDSLRGTEGESANQYFSVFDHLILQQKADFCFSGRSRRPPLDRVNALLSFGYSMLTSMCVSALESAGLDSYVGFFHTLRPGRCALALDLVEELRAPFADRFVLTIINRKMICSDDFYVKENGAVLLTDDGRKSFLTMWQAKKKEVLMHPFLQEKVEWGLIPFVQAMLLAKYIRGDLDDYPPFIWK